MDDKAARVTDVGKVGKQLEVCDQFHAGIIPTLEADGEHSACTFGRVALGKRVIAIRLQTGVADPINVRARVQIFSHHQRVVRMALHAQGQGFDALQNHEGVERRQGWPKVTQTQDTASDSERKRAEGFTQHHAAVLRTRLRERRITSGFDPVKIAAIHNNAAYGVSVTA